MSLYSREIDAQLRGTCTWPSLDYWFKRYCSRRGEEDLYNKVSHSTITYSLDKTSEIMRRLQHKLPTPAAVSTTENRSPITEETPMDIEALLGELRFDQLEIESMEKEIPSKITKKKSNPKNDDQLLSEEHMLSIATIINGKTNQMLTQPVQT